MLPASNSGLGMNFGFPDVCLTPPAAEPIPYPNFAMHEMAVPFAPNVLISFVPGLNMGAETPITLGDETGDMSPFMGPGRFWMGNPTVLLNALPAISLLCPTNGNDFINPIGAVVVPAITNVFYSRAGATAGDLSVEALQALARVLTTSGAFEAARLSDGIAYVRVPIFSSGVPAQVYDALQRFGADGCVSALIVDVRGCPGGELVAAVELASDFLPPGAVIVTAVDGDGDETVYRARGGGPQVPLFVLVDGLTASSAEIFAGSLRAHGRAVVVGARTYGKGSAQELRPGTTGARYETVATFLLPDGEPIEGRGIHPDLAVASGAALDAALDSMRATAMSLLSLDEVR